MSIEQALSSGGARGSKFYIDIPLNGEIDLSELKNKNLDEIHFSEGTISRIYNIPKGIKKIVINNNRLTELPHLELRDLVHLEANNNELTRVDLRDMVSLALLDVNNNKIRKIENLPPSLQQLYVDNNNLDVLDLNGADSCTSVSCMNNIGLQRVIGGKQISNQQFKINKDSHTQLVIRGGQQGGTKPKEDVLYTDVKQAVNEYYEMKNAYEKNRKEIIKKIMNGSGSRKNKIQKVQNARFTCVNCGKEGGTRFEKLENHLIARCGNKENPCKLNISILSSLSVSESEIAANQEEINLAKQKIVQTKMNTLFGYIKDDYAIKIFEENLNKIKVNNYDHELMNDRNNSYYEMQNDNKKNSIISRKMEYIHQELAEIRRIMKEYEASGNKKLLTDAAVKHVAIKETLNVIRAIKYPIHEVVEEETYNYIDAEGNFLDESKAPKTTLNVLKQYPYNFDDFLNPNLELLVVQNFSV
jgi:hypothetical protein